MNTKNGDKVQSEMKPNLQQNQQMQTKIDNIQTISFNTECRSLIENYQTILRQFYWRLNQLKNKLSILKKTILLLCFLPFSFYFFYFLIGFLG